MKRFFSAAVAAIILVVSVFSLNAFAASTTKTEALLEKMNTSKEIAVTLRTGNSGVFGKTYGVTNTVYVKNDKFAYDFDNGTIKIRAVMKDDDIIGFIPAFPYFYMKASNPFATGDDMWDTIKNISNITMGILYHVDSYTETVDGTAYWVEEFNDREDVTSKFYYSGDELKILRVEDVAKNTVQYTYFDSISFTVDDSVFNTPLVAFDLTPILKILFTMIVAA